MEDLVLSPAEYQVLLALDLLNDHNPDWGYTYRCIKNEIPYSMTLYQMKKAAKALREKGLIRYTYFCDEDSEYLRGSGHMIEDFGIKYLKWLSANAQQPD